MAEQNFIVGGNIEEGSERDAGVSEDLRGGGGAVGDFGEAQAGVLMVEEGVGGGCCDGGGEAGGAGAEVGDFVAGGHCGGRREGGSRLLAGRG